MSTRMLIRGGRVIDPSCGLDETTDLLLEDGVVRLVERGIDPGSGVGRGTVVDAAGLWVLPGLVDLHTHLREPGYEYKETIATGAAAAAAGGFTSIMCMPNTRPVNDSAAVTAAILRAAREARSARIYPIGAITVGQAGEMLSEMADLAAAGCRGFSDDGRPVMNAFVMRKALEYARFTGLPVIAHAEDLNLAAGGSMHEGAVSAVLGLRGIPSSAEEVMVARDCILARESSGRLHVAHVSTRGTIAIIAAARAAGLAVSCEVTPHHLFLTDEAVRSFDTATKVNPPLRSEEDRLACIRALADGTIDCVASDHAPHGLVDKEVEYDQAAFGISGIETSLGLCLSLVHDGTIVPSALVERMSTRPAVIAGLPAGTLSPGSAADAVLVDPELAWTVDPSRFLSRGRNTPFAGRELRGRAVLTIVGGRAVFTHPAVVDRVDGPHP